MIFTLVDMDMIEAYFVVAIRRGADAFKKRAASIVKEEN
jgi:hypothetical protein